MNDAVIQLLRRDGTVRAEVLIDETDAEWLGQWRWHLSGDGYARRMIRVAGKQIAIPMHRQILGLLPGDLWQGDHRSRNTLDNRRSNLRRVPPGANAQNVPSRAGTISRFRGVTFDRVQGKWRAFGTAQLPDGRRKTIHLGRFVSEAEAAVAASAYRAKHMPYAVEAVA